VGKRYVDFEIHLSYHAAARGIQRLIPRNKVARALGYFLRNDEDVERLQDDIRNQKPKSLQLVAEVTHLLEMKTTPFHCYLFTIKDRGRGKRNVLVDRHGFAIIMQHVYYRNLDSSRIKRRLQVAAILSSSSLTPYYSSIQLHIEMS
jgi:hypothetical protein